MPKGLSEGDMVRITAIYLFTFAICIYFLSISNVYVADQHIQRYQVAKSIVEKGELSIPESAYSIRGMDGRDYSLYGLVWPILVIPFYMVGKFIGWHPENLMLLLNPMVGAATVTLVFLFSIALGYSRRSSLVVAIFYGLGTLAWPMAKHPFDHTVETLFVLLSVYSMYLHSTNNAVIHLVLSALCLGVAINTRLVSILSLPALLVLIGAGCGVNSSLSENTRGFFHESRERVFLLLSHRCIFLLCDHTIPEEASLAGHRLYSIDSIVSAFPIKKQILAWRSGMGATLPACHHPICNSPDNGSAGFRSLDE